MLMDNNQLQSTTINHNQQKSTKINKNQQKSTKINKINKNQQLTYTINDKNRKQRNPHKKSNIFSSFPTNIKGRRSLKGGRREEGV